MKTKIIFRVFVYTFAVIGFILVAGFFAVKWGLTDTKGVMDPYGRHIESAGTQKIVSPLPWTSGEEWKTFEVAAIKEEPAISRAAAQTGVSSRLILSLLFVEQMRLYHSERELFKTVFQPLALLGNQSKFSWGIMGLKEKTAIATEEHLRDSASPFYLGPTYEHLLDFSTENTAEERFLRIINEENHYYSYLYAGLYLKQITRQWELEGHDISNQPEILSTLFNIGFENSHPNPAPRSGGSEIEINGTTYSFGSLAHEFYYSGELADFFPY